MDNDLTFEEYQRFWYRRYKDMFGERTADKWLYDNLSHHTALKVLWVRYGFHTVGEFKAWEKDHKDEYEEFMRRYK